MTVEQRNTILSILSFVAPIAEDRRMPVTHIVSWATSESPAAQNSRPFRCHENAEAFRIFVESNNGTATVAEPRVYDDRARRMERYAELGLITL